MAKVLVVGDLKRIEEFKALNLAFDQIMYMDQNQFQHAKWPDAEVVFDLNLDENPIRLSLYADKKGLIVIGSAVKRTLAEMAFNANVPIECTLAGANFLPTFINRTLWEVSVQDPKKKDEVIKFFQGKQPVEVVEDRVGLVTARILFMIINEAFFLLQEGTADVSGVDQAMKLGTNYPKGPFEWASEIGIHHVYEVLTRIHEETGDSRYKISQLLKTHYLNEMIQTR